MGLEVGMIVYIFNHHIQQLQLCPDVFISPIYLCVLRWCSKLVFGPPNRVQNIEIQACFYLEGKTTVNPFADINLVSEQGGKTTSNPFADISLMFEQLLSQRETQPTTQAIHPFKSLKSISLPTNQKLKQRPYNRKHRCIGGYRLFDLKPYIDKSYNKGQSLDLDHGLYRLMMKFKYFIF